MPPDLKHHEDAGKWVCGWMGVLKLSPVRNQRTNGVVTDAFRTHVGRGNFSKNQLTKTAVSAWEHVTRLDALVNVLLVEYRQLAEKVMEGDARVIALQSQLLASKKAQLEAVTSAVQNVVKESVAKSYSEVANSQPAQSYPAISSAAIERAVKDIAEGEERSKNVIVFGLEERDGESVAARVGEVFGVLGEKPRPEEVSRMGTKREGQHRPIIVKLRNSAAASGLLRKSQGLRDSEFKRVFISPDRTVTQRAHQRQLVTDMRKRAAEDKSRRFFVRDGEVQSVQRVGSGGRGSSDEESSDDESSEEEDTDIEIRSD